MDIAPPEVLIYTKRRRSGVSRLVNSPRHFSERALLLCLFPLRSSSANPSAREQRAVKGLDACAALQCARLSRARFTGGWRGGFLIRSTELRFCMLAGCVSLLRGWVGFGFSDDFGWRGSGCVWVCDRVSEDVA